MYYLVLIKGSNRLRLYDFNNRKHLRSYFYTLHCVDGSYSLGNYKWLSTDRSNGLAVFNRFRAVLVINKFKWLYSNIPDLKIEAVRLK